jgi:DNA-binding response OmpR family regulator
VSGSEVPLDVSTLATSVVPLATVLLVEDEQSIRKLISRILRRRGYTVLEAADGADALRISDEHAGTVDLVLTDLVMPGLGGVEVAARLSVKWPRVKVVYMSGYGKEDLRTHGVTDPALFLPKPFRPDELVLKIGEALC